MKNKNTYNKTEYMRAWREKNRVKYKEYMDAYNKKYFSNNENNVKALERASKFYNENRESVLLKAKNRYNDNKVLKGRKKGASHHRWKGDECGYFAKHSWIERELGKPMKCSACGTDSKNKYHWANISDMYKRDVSDWVRLCVSCHRIFDYIKNENSMCYGIKQETIEKAPKILKELAKQAK